MIDAGFDHGVHRDGDNRNMVHPDDPGVTTAHTLPVVQAAPATGPDARFYHPELDVMRFVAFALVFVHHILPRSSAEYAGGTLTVFDRPWFFAIVNLGGFGLSLFFFLSAFLITWLLCAERDRTGSVAIGDFYVRRGLRIWPLYGVCLAIAALYGGISHGFGASVASSDWLMIGLYALMIGNWFFASGAVAMWPANPMTPLWSISVEEQFYLFWPWLMRSTGTRGVAWASAAMLAVALAVEGYLGNAHTDRDITIWTNSFVCFEFFATGALCALCLRKVTLDLSVTSRFLLGAIAAALWLAANLLFGVKAIAPAPDALAVIAGYALVAAGCIAILLAMWGWTRWPPALVRLGRISYGLYSFHMLAALCVRHALIWFDPVLFDHGLFAAAIRAFWMLALTVVAAELSYRYFETPFLQYKERFAAVLSRPV